MRKAVVIGIVFLSGFCALVYQITWERILRYIWGGDVISMTIVTSVFLLGLGIGAFLFGRLHRKPAAVYGLIQIALGGSLIGIFIPLGVWQWRTRKEAAVRRRGTGWYALYFAGLGFGYILVELNLIQKFSILQYFSVNA